VALTNDKNLLAKEVLELSGTKKQISQIPQFLEGSLAGQKGKLDEQTFNTLCNIMRDAFKAETLYENLESTFIKNIDTKTLKDTKLWYQSELAKKITKLEIKASTPDSMQEMQKFAENFQKTPPPQSRIALAKDLDNYSKSTEMTLNMILGITEGIMTGINASLPAKQKMKHTDLKKQIDTTQAMLKPSIESTTLVSFLFTYKDLTDKEFESYVSFHKSKVGQTFNKSLWKAMNHSFSQASNTIGKNMGQTLKNTKPKSNNDQKANKQTSGKKKL